ncbi:hypothetical protein HKBW3S03_00957 [Candidatus Hakubella thermalkaliphila]|uniref:DUF3786 domain-containing protein n=3 Tax=Candidatus Hakubella thermalkaliphila TaxID=2754717 RepID=A0A6V8NGM6_9ACTN|nr:DUF3786 domain-containing protein [Candidatus Hakubella thermalkaliphila]GFP19452.1 hypothetical protein HKBW3S03_00957 [Candidatus Hakubella thermalkaliphila]GFP29718.1 hypothetical protein HKBW3S34_00638 [Candidatus Hakubella thermalkaliphila]GFP39535.1 hypothetical protein HKBW3S47_01233 [Candidatus Hakubella thermalkaliphila]GFP43031.1 hypothetical protein HKBW3C_02163 [Candidatus Hakubella thermalkaliphila]
MSKRVPGVFPCSGFYFPAKLKHQHAVDILINRIQHLPLTGVSTKVGGLYEPVSDTIRIRMLGQEYTVGKNGAFLKGEEAPETETIILLWYLLTQGTTPWAGSWKTYLELEGAYAHESYFRQSSEARLAHGVEGILAKKEVVLSSLDGIEAEKVGGCGLAIRFQVLPRIYILCQFYLQDEEFPAQTKILFSDNANDLLSTECLRELGILLAKKILNCLQL